MDIQTITSAGKGYRAIYIYKCKAVQEFGADVYVSFGVVSWALVDDDRERTIKPVIINLNGEAVVAPEEIEYSDDEFGPVAYLGVVSPDDDEEVIQEWIERQYSNQFEEN